MQNCCLSCPVSRTFGVRWIQSSAIFLQRKKSFYDILGLSKNCTTKQVKAAYFELSKTCHPDKNDGVEAADKFREITAAYEVLKNKTLRREYDRGGDYEDIGYREPQMRRKPDPEVVRPHRETPQGRTANFDFGTWERMHYGDQFERQQRAKMRSNYQEMYKKEQEMNSKMNRAIFVSFAVFVVLVFSVALDISSKDDPKPIKKS